MDKISKNLTSFMIIALKIIFAILFISGLGYSFVLLRGVDIPFIVMLSYYLLSILGIIYLLKNERIKFKYKIVFILGIALIGKLMWLYNFDAKPISDFNTMYQSGKDLLNGSTAAFHGTGYIARFPHLTVMSLYFAAMTKLFGESLIPLDIVNVILGLLSVYLIFKIVYKIFDNQKYAIIGGGIAAIYPPFITYSAVYCTENIAIPFYLISVYLLMCVAKDNKGLLYILLSGITLSIGHLFRSVAYVAVIAVIMYIILYLDRKVFDKVKLTTSFIVGFLVILIGTSTVLRGVGITEFNLWKGSEPNSTNILKGTNVQYHGMWNPDDAKVPELCGFEYEKTDEMAKAIIKERLTTTPPSVLMKFYFEKFVSQWSDGDNAGIFWSQVGAKENNNGYKYLVLTKGKTVTQFFFSGLMLLCLLALLNRKKIDKYKEINFFFIMFGGYIAAYLITENQSRYSYIVSWFFIIIAILGIDYLKDNKESIKKVVKKCKNLLPGRDKCES